MLELARGLQKIKRAKNASPICVRRFDGEEATDDSDFLGTGVRGSKAFAKKHRSELKEIVLLDFVADKNLAIPREQSSDAGDVGATCAPPPSASARTPRSRTRRRARSRTTTRRSSRARRPRRST